MNSLTVPDEGLNDVGEATGVVIGVDAAVDDPSRHMNEEGAGCAVVDGGFANFTDRRSVSFGRSFPFIFKAVIAA